MSHHVDVRHMKKFQTQGGGGFLCWLLTLSANNVQYRFYISPVLPASYIQYGLRRVVNMKLCETNNRECENLQVMAVGLRTEWSKLKAEMKNLLKKCERVKDENKSIMEELTKIYGRDAISDLIAMESDAETESDDEETTLSEQNQTTDSRMLLEVRR
ncbi:hypothetical protein BDE02_04G130800 [Populus trichocarpa]|nr:hypothetical protein BDE02_04G130800 [Populus trichocarpa]